jgi:acyl-ACP thioesterase
MVQAAALWVPLDSSGRPLRLEREFLALYGEAAAGRRVTGRVPAPVSPGAATTQPWPIRRADLDVVGHVNNAAVWTALSEVAPGPVESASMTHHGAVEEGQVVTLASAPGRIWLTVNAEVKVSGEFFPA